MDNQFKNLPQSADKMQDIIEIGVINGSPHADWLRSLLVALVTLLVLLLVVLLVKYIYKKIKGRLVTISPEERAGKALGVLKTKNLITQGRTPFYYFRLDEIFRSYMEEKFNVEVLEKTFEELEQDQQQLDPYFNKEQMSRLMLFWERCQMSKFANAERSEEQGLEDYKFVNSVIERTKANKQNSDTSKKGSV